MDLQLLKTQLIEAGQLSDFMDVLGKTSAIYNCTTERCLPIDGVVSGNIYRRQMVIDKAGCVFEGHSHNFDHVTYVIRGSVVIKYFDTDENNEMILSTVKEQDYSAPSAILIKKNKAHQIMAMTDDVIAECVYALRDEAGNVTDKFTGSKYPYL